MRGSTEERECEGGKKGEKVREREEGSEREEFTAVLLGYVGPSH
jgi:hypothetical protein